MIKTLNKVDRGKYNMIKVMYKKPTTNTILDGEKLNMFPLLPGAIQGCPLFPLLFT